MSNELELVLLFALMFWAGLFLGPLFFAVGSLWLEGWKEKKWEWERNRTRRRH